jgi:hypothetical protein
VNQQSSQFNHQDRVLRQLAALVNHLAVPLNQLRDVVRKAEVLMNHQTV